MAKVKFTTALKRFFPELEETHIQGNSIKDIISNLETKHPGITSYLLEEDGVLRKHVNVFIDNNLVTDPKLEKDLIADNQEIFIMQALSGG